jgi:cytochrome b561/polyisoprenoid-binding protein YceI
MNDPSASRYTATAIGLHWLGAALVLAGFCVGLWMTGLEFGPLKFRVYAYHKWIGVTVFLVALLRLAWRSRHPPPPPGAMPRWQRRAAAVAHGLLYALMLAVPASGWLYSSAAGVQTVWLGLVPLPDLVAKDKELAAALKVVHFSLNASLAALVLLHVAAALKHQFVDRDALLARMLPGRRPPATGKALPMRLIAPFVPPLAAMLLAASPDASSQGVAVERSDIRFVSRQMGANVEGRFRKWKANVDFRPQDPARSRAEIEIDLASIDLASEESEAELRRPTWFDTRQFPTAKFVSTAVRGLPGDRYEVAGQLSMKGVTRDVMMPVQLKRDAAGMSVAEGQLTLQRLDFHVGDGPWADTDTVANDVVVRVRMVLPPVR